MAIGFAKRKYKKSIKMYEMLIIEDLLELTTKIKEKYYNFIFSVEEMQEVVNIMASFYENEYVDEPDSYKAFYKLKNQLSYDYKQLLECNYFAPFMGRARYNYLKPLEEPDVLLYILLKQQSKEEFKNDILIVANSNNGKVVKVYGLDNNEIEPIIDKKNLVIDELFSILENNLDDTYDYTQLEECISNHTYSIELRKKVLQWLVLKLSYIEYFNYEIGYEKIKLFMVQLNQELCLDLDEFEIENIINTIINLEPKQKKRTYQLRIF